MKIKIKNIITVGIIAMALVSCSGNLQKADYNVIPLPKTITENTNDNPFIISKKVSITYPTQLPNLAKEAGFLMIHVFPYSPREGTKAAVMPGQLSKAVKERRTRELIALGEETAAAYQQMWVGKESTVLIEEKIGDS